MDSFMPCVALAHISQVKRNGNCTWSLNAAFSTCRIFLTDLFVSSLSSSPPPNVTPQSSRNLKGTVVSASVSWSMSLLAWTQFSMSSWCPLCSNLSEKWASHASKNIGLWMVLSGSSRTMENTVSLSFFSVYVNAIMLDYLRLYPDYIEVNWWNVLSFEKSPSSGMLTIFNFSMNFGQFSFAVTNSCTVSKIWKEERIFLNRYLWFREYACWSVLWLIC